MKTTKFLNWTVACLSALAVSGATHARADQTGDKQDKSYVGTVSAVDANDHLIKVRGVFLTRKFNIGDNCSFRFLNTGSGSGSITGLRQGQKVLVDFRKVDGFRVADLVQQEPMIFEGTVKEIDSRKDTMSVSHMGLEKTFKIAPACPIDLYNQKTGTLANVQPGNRVTVTYEIPNGGPIARRIAQTSQVFTGELTAIDLSDRTAKARDVLDHKRFNLAPDCTVVFNGRPGGNLRDFKLGQRVEFDYVDVNGISIVNRVAPASQSAPRMTASSGSPLDNPAPVVPNTY